MIPTQHPSRDNRDFISVPIFIKQLLRAWPWFLLSLAIAVLLIAFMGRNIVLGTAEYKMSVMTRFPFSDKAFIQEGEDNKMLWERVPAYDVNQVFGVLLTSDIIARAGKAVGYDVDYSQKHSGRRYDVYNDLPYKIIFLDLYSNDLLSMKALWKGNNVLLSEVRGTFRGKAIVMGGADVVTVAPGDTVKTPMGRLVCLPQVDEGIYPRTSLNLALPVDVTKINGNAAKTRFDKDLKLQVFQGNSLLMEMAVAGSPRRVIEVMNKIIALCQEQVKTLISKDLDENDTFIRGALEKLDAISMDASAKAAEKEVLLKKLARNQSNRETLEIKDLIVVTDPPAMRPAPAASTYFILILLILSLTIPSLYVYYFRIRNGAVLEPANITRQMRQRIIGKYIYAPRAIEKGGRAKEQLLIDIDAVRLAFPKADQILQVSPSNTRQAAWFAGLLAENISRSGRKVLRLHFTPEGKKAPEGAQEFPVKAGYLGSDVFLKDLKGLKELHREGTLIIFSADESIVELLIPYFQDLLITIVAEKSPKTKVKRLNRLFEKKDMLNGADARIHVVWIDIPLCPCIKK